MGSLTSSPDLPPPQPRQTIIRQPAPQPSGGADSTRTESASDTAPEENQQDQPAQQDRDSGADETGRADNETDNADDEQQRAAALLRDRRGRESTINTGFRGVLEPREAQPKRKTLLGG